jgi:hypothetical protein
VRLRVLLHALSPGELSERVNARIAALGLVTRYMHGTNREGRLERTLFLHERALDERLHLVLVDMVLRAHSELDVTREELKAATTQLQHMLLDAGTQVTD